MSWAHIHLALSHVPVIGLLIVLLLLAVARLRRSTELTRVSYALLVLLAASAVVVYLTGEPAEELVENLPGFSEAIVEEHEEVALIATIGTVVLGLVALVGLIRFRGPRIAPRLVRPRGRAPGTADGWCDCVDSKPGRSDPALGDPGQRGSRPGG